MPSGRRLFQASLAAASAAMLLFLGGYLGGRLGLGALSGLIYQSAAKLLLLSFAATGLLGLAAAAANLRRDLNCYFSREAAALRRLSANYHLILRQKQTQREQRRQLAYRYNARRQKMAARDESKQLARLHRAVKQELNAAKDKLSPEHYRQYRQNLRRYRGQFDAKAMLDLRERLPCR